jgi:hypothetical protein
MIPIYVMVYQPQTIMNVRLYCTTFYRVLQRRFKFLCAHPLGGYSMWKEECVNQGNNSSDRNMASKKNF